MPVSVRLATPQDARQLAELRWLSRDAAERDREPFEEFQRGFDAWLAAAAVSDIWRIAVATSAAGTLLGCMYLHFVEKVPTPGEPRRRWAYVTHAYVREGHRGAGIGSSLLAMLVELAWCERLDFLIVWPSGRAVPFYERAGFLSPERERQALPDDEPAFILHLAK
jgi:GNAT superfamily N-acetyltransferase